MIDYRIPPIIHLLLNWRKIQYSYKLDFNRNAFASEGFEVQILAAQLQSQRLRGPFRAGRVIFPLIPAITRSD
jgi:hypothetical protein